jgi:pimeloyl-ACP methyl ester carboxylesterase
MTELQRDGVAIHYEVHGRATGATPLLLTHGYGASAEMWAPNLAALGADRPVIAWDIRGHGLSASPDDPARYSQAASVDDMAAILDACGTERAILVGHSLGGFLSLAFHLAHPERVAALVLFSTGPGFKQDDARARWNEMAERFARRFERKGLEALDASPETAAGRHDPFGLARAARGILVQRDASIIESLPTIAVPTLVVVGVHDERFLAAADYQAGRIRGAQKVVIAGAQHAANIEQTEAFDRAVGAFLAELAPS